MYLPCHAGTLILSSLCLCSQPTLSARPAIPTYVVCFDYLVFYAYVWYVCLSSKLCLCTYSAIVCYACLYSLLHLTYVVCFYNLVFYALLCLPNLMYLTSLLCLCCQPTYIIVLYALLDFYAFVCYVYLCTQPTLSVIPAIPLPSLLWLLSLLCLYTYIICSVSFFSYSLLCLPSLLWLLSPFYLSQSALLTYLYYVSYKVCYDYNYSVLCLFMQSPVYPVS